MFIYFLPKKKTPDLCPDWNRDGEDLVYPATAKKGEA
jgi:hypothetical protein